MKNIKVYFCTSIVLLFMIFPLPSHARSSKSNTIGIFGLGNIQVLNTLPEINPGPGGGAYYDYRFNQRFSITGAGWATTHNGTGRSAGDNNILILGLPTVTLKFYFIENERSKWDPYAGLGVGLYALSEGSIGNGTSGFGLGANVEVGFDYYFTDLFSLGFAGTFHSVGIVTNLSGSGNNATAVLPFSMAGRFGYHF